MDVIEKRDELYKDFKKAHPETIGEKDKAFDNDNFIDFLVLKILEKESIQTLEEAGSDANDADQALTEQKGI